MIIIGYSRVFGVGAASYADEVTADSPVHWWRLGEASGTLYDTAGTNDGTPLNVGYGVTGAVAGNNAIYLNGSNTGVSIAVGNCPIGSNARSIEFWYNGTSTTKQTVFSYGTGGATRQSFGCALNDGGSPRITLWTWADDKFVTATGLLDGNWHHIVYTYAASASTVKVYMDGSLLGTMTFGGALNTGSTAAVIGGDYVNPGANEVTGNIDEIAVYASELSSTRVQAHYDARSV